MAVLSSAAGLGSAHAESTLYVTVYFPESSSDYVAFRFTIPVLLHMVASFIFGLGITSRLRAAVNGEGPLAYRDWWFFIAAVVLHSVFNVTVVVLELFTDTLPV